MFLSLHSLIVESRRYYSAMVSISPFLSELFRAFGMTGAGIVMLLLGMRISKCSNNVFNLISITAGLAALTAAATHFQPVRAYLGYIFDVLGGEGAVAGYALLILLGAARTRTRSSMFIVGACLAFLVIVPFAFSSLYWRYFGVEIHANYPEKDGCILQSSGVTCAPASASMLLNKYGIRVSEGLLAERAGTNLIGGTNEYSLARAIQSVVSANGYIAKAENISLRQLCKLNRPVVAFMMMPNIGGHAILVESLNVDTVNIIDPLNASQEKIPITEFKDKWTGTVISISKKD